MDPTATRPFGRSGLRLTRLGFGAAPLGGLYAPLAEDEAEGAVRAAHGAGIRYFDTAPLYGHGLSEHRVGRALRGVPRDGFVLSTKVGRLLRPRPEGVTSELFAETLPFEPVFDYGYDATLRSLDDSLQRLGLARIDLALIHDVSPRWHGDALERRFAEAMDGAYRALDRLRGEGTIKAIGVGVNDVRVCLRFAAAGDFDGFMLAGRYTLLDQGALDEFLPYCAGRGIGVVVAAPFGSGILATGTAAAGGARYFYQPAPPEVVERVRRIEAVCARHGVPLPAAALRFPLGHPAVTGVVAGCRSRAEVERNVALARHAIPAAFWAELKDGGLIPDAAPVPA